MNKIYKIIIIGVLFACAICSWATFGLLVLIDQLPEPSNNTSIGEKAPKETDVSKAWIMCQEIVKSQLVSPSTAEFQPYPQIAWGQTEDGGVVIRSWVEAQNSYGALIRRRIECGLKYKGGPWTIISSWIVTSLVIGE